MTPLYSVCRGFISTNPLPYILTIYFIILFNFIQGGEGVGSSLQPTHWCTSVLFPEGADSSKSKYNSFGFAISLLNEDQCKTVDEHNSVHCRIRNFSDIEHNPKYFNILWVNIRSHAAHIDELEAFWLSWNTRISYQSPKHGWMRLASICNLCSSTIIFISVKNARVGEQERSYHRAHRACGPWWSKMLKLDFFQTASAFSLFFWCKGTNGKIKKKLHVTYHWHTSLTFYPKSCSMAILSPCSL